MRKLAFSLGLFFIVALVSGLAFYLGVLHTSYTAQASELKSMRKQLKTLQKEVLYLQSMNYTQYLITKKHWEVIDRTYKKPAPTE